MSVRTPYKEDKEDFFYFKLSKKDTFRFINHSDFVKEQLKDNKEALRAFKKLINLFKSLEDDIRIHYNANIKILSPKIITYFKNKENKKWYYFHEGYFRFEDMINDTLFHIYKHIHDNKTITEDECISICHQSIIEYTDRMTKTFRRTYFKKRIYKLSVLCGYITMQMGFYPSKEIKQEAKEEDITNAMINKAVEYRITKFEKEKAGIK